MDAPQKWIQWNSKPHNHGNPSSASELEVPQNFCSGHWGSAHVEVQWGERLLTNWYRILLHALPKPLRPQSRRTKIFRWVEQLRDQHSTGGKERYCFANRSAGGKCEACRQVLKQESRFKKGGKRGNGRWETWQSPVQAASMNQQTSEMKPPLGVFCLFWWPSKWFFKNIYSTCVDLNVNHHLHLNRSNGHLRHSHPDRFSLFQTNSRKQQMGPKVNLQKELFFFLDFLPPFTGDESGYTFLLLSKQQDIFQWAAQNIF